MQRSVRGEVWPPATTVLPPTTSAVAELAVERAKRIVEQGRDVVILFDSLTRMGRAYNLAAPASSRILAGGIATTALPRAQEVLRRRAQHREGRLADHPGDRAGRHRLPDGRGHLRGVQGHRQHGALARPRAGRAAHLPRRRHRCLGHPARGTADPARGTGRTGGCAAPCTASTVSRPSRCCWRRSKRGRSTPRYCSRWSRPPEAALALSGLYSERKLSRTRS